VRRRLAWGLAALPLLALSGPASAAPSFRAEVRPLAPAERRAMTPSVWRPGCPVALADLRRVGVPYIGFDSRIHRGALVVHRDVAPAIVRVMRTLYEARFPIRRMRPIEAYGGDDFASIEADNTSAFNCRRVEGTARWSEHAYGRAIDVNPIENPYIANGRTSHPASVPYLDRSRYRKGMAVEGRTLVRAFDAVRWGWGGRWQSVLDLQHFSARGR
jgi:hypothetical protein